MTIRSHCLRSIITTIWWERLIYMQDFQHVSKYNLNLLHKNITEKGSVLLHGSNKEIDSYISNIHSIRATATYISSSLFFLTSNTRQETYVDYCNKHHMTLRASKSLWWKKRMLITFTDSTGHDVQSTHTAYVVQTSNRIRNQKPRQSKGEHFAQWNFHDLSFLLLVRSVPFLCSMSHKMWTSSYSHVLTSLWSLTSPKRFQKDTWCLLINYLRCKRKLHATEMNGLIYMQGQ